VKGWRRWTVNSAAFLLGLGAAAWWAGSGPGGLASPAEEEPVKAPEFDGAAGWVGVEKPLRLADLRGKVVLLDFWTYG